jgi:PhnB protein
MQSKINAYISFNDNAREAMEFYKTVFGGKLTVSTFKEFHVSSDPSEDNKLMHAMLEAENGIVIMGADTPKEMNYHDGARISISLSGDNEEELRAYWDKLSEEATVEQPLTQAQWGDTFGMLTDKFGIHWMVNIFGKKS